MRIHSLLIAGALAGLMANATPARALDVNAPVLSYDEADEPSS